MDIVGRRRSMASGRSRVKSKKQFTRARADGAPRDYQRYQHRMQLYSLPPIEEVSLEDFERFAVDRLKVLKSIETAKIRWPKRGDEFNKNVRAILKEYLPLSSHNDMDEMYDERRKDHLSHFILRLAYCKSEDLRRWFLTQECELFRYRFDGESSQDVNMFLRQNGMKYHPMERDAKMALLPKLRACGFMLTEEQVMKTDYFQVDFEEALELVKMRKVYVAAGQAYVPRNEIMSIIAGAFRARLSAALTATSKALPNLEEDSRLLPMLSNLSKQYLGADYGESKSKMGQVSAADIPQLADESFPMCMKNSHQHLTEHHHLKHGARMQYGLFLKGIGITLEDALLFWRTEFTKSMGGDKFEKNYAYNIRHNYGKEGKRTDYTPYSCMKIIMSNAPGTGDAHGCPFKHYDADSLKMKMMQYKVPANAIREISDYVAGQHYQLACVKYFEATHGSDAHADFVLQHPNQYFEKSREIRTGGESMDTSGGSAFAAKKPVAARGGEAAATEVATTAAVPAQEMTDEDLLAAMELDFES